MRTTLALAAALLLVSTLAVPAQAQRGHGRSGHYSGHSGHGGHYGHGAHRYGGSHRSHGYRHHGRSYGGHRGYHGYRGGHGYRGHRGYHGYRGSRGHHGNYGGHGYYGYPGAYGYSYGGRYRHHVGYGYKYPSRYRGYRPYGSYVYYRSPGTYGFGYYGYPGISIVYDASPSYVVRGGRYDDYTPRYERYQPRYQGYELTAPEAGVTETGEPSSAGEPYDARSRPARVMLTIEPADASVYLDGRFLGLASELSGELWVDPGAHRLEVVRPGFLSRELDLDLEPGEELEVDGRLRPSE